MNDEPFLDPPAPGAAPHPSRPPASGARLWAERIGIGLVAIVALAAPILIGLTFFLALGDGLVINGDDPAREARLWLIQERRGFTGLALSIAAPAEASARDARCARTQVTFLKWDRSIRLEPQARYCQCFVQADGQWVGSLGTCQP